jgi:O-antigen ligase
MMFLVLMSLRLRRPAGKRDSTTAFRRVASQAAIVISIAAVISAGILWIGADPVINRVTQGHLANEDSPKETFFSSRGWVWRDTFTMIRANPLLGVGLGAYETAFSIYTKSDGSLRVPQAHNDYLQVVADCGVIGGLIAVWFIAAAFRSVVRGAQARDPLYAGLALGCGAGMFGILVHSLFDFNLQLPSNALLFLLLSAVAVRVGTVVGGREGAAPIAFHGDSARLGTQSVSTSSLARGA